MSQASDAVAQGEKEGTEVPSGANAEAASPESGAVAEGRRRRSQFAGLLRSLVFTLGILCVFAVLHYCLTLFLWMVSVLYALLGTDFDPIRGVLVGVFLTHGMILIAPALALQLGLKGTDPFPSLFIAAYLAFTVILYIVLFATGALVPLEDHVGHIPSYHVSLFNS